MFRLALNAGHGYNTAGKRCLKSIDPNETKEYVLNKRICDLIEEAFKDDDISILRIDDGSELTIAQRTKKANDWGADLYLAIHHNAGINGGAGGGIEVYVYTHVDADTVDWQAKFYDALIRYTNLKGNRAQPLRRADLGECRQTEMPAVLLECGFMDSTSDTPIILTEGYAGKVAAACVDVITAKAGIKNKPTVIPITKKKTVDELAAEVIKGLWGDGEIRASKLTNAGYDYAAVQKKVNEMLKTPSKKSNTVIADEVIDGKWGNGLTRRIKLKKAGYDPSAIQRIVNQLMGKRK
jgi:hypothetical protein